MTTVDFSVLDRIEAQLAALRADVALLLAEPPTTPAPPLPVTVFGDSITVGVGASSSNKSWAGLLGGQRQVSNSAASGDQAADQSAKIQAASWAADRSYAIMVGTNDHRTYRSDAAKQAAFKAFVRQCIAWLAIPSKTIARSSSVTYTGTWGNTVANTIGKQTTAMGAKASASFTGSGVVVGYILQQDLAAMSTATVKIDGVSVGSLSSYATMSTVNGRTYAPAAAYFGGLADGPHTIEIENTVAGKIFYLDYVAAVPKFSPRIVVSNVIRMTPAAYTTYNTSEANVIAFNAQIQSVVGEFASHGLPVVLVDNCSGIDPAIHLPDGVHPNDAGHSIIHANFQAGLLP